MPVANLRWLHSKPKHIFVFFIQAQSSERGITVNNLQTWKLGKILSCVHTRARTNRACMLMLCVVCAQYRRYQQRGDYHYAQQTLVHA